MNVKICELQYALKAADILRPPQHGSSVFGVMRGHLQSARFDEGPAAKMVSKGGELH